MMQARALRCIGRRDNRSKNRTGVAALGGSLQRRKSAIEIRLEAFKAAPRITHAEQLDGIEQGIERFLGHRLQDDAEQAGHAGEVVISTP